MFYIVSHDDGGRNSNPVLEDLQSFKLSLLIKITANKENQ